MNHKRKRPKNRRAGCIMCKFWKANGYPKGAYDSMKFSEYSRLKDANEQIKNVE